jgi:xanthine dehydrogenase accessory factor
MKTNYCTNSTVLIRGAGDIASGIALRLHHCGFQILMTETARPSCVRRTVAFAPCVEDAPKVTNHSSLVTNGSSLFDRRVRVEDTEAVCVRNETEARAAFAEGFIAVTVCDGIPDWAALLTPAPYALVDAIIAKRNLGTRLTDAPRVIAVGPGFTAGVDCHYVIESSRGARLGRVIGPADNPPAALPNTGVPGDIGGYSAERVIRAPAEGAWRPLAAIGDRVESGAPIAEVKTPRGAITVHANIPGVIRGLLPEGFPVTPGFKCGDIDPRCKREACFLVSDKALALAGGVLEALLRV